MPEIPSPLSIWIGPLTNAHSPLLASRLLVFTELHVFSNTPLPPLRLTHIILPPVLTAEAFVLTSEKDYRISQVILTKFGHSGKL